MDRYIVDDHDWETREVYAKFGLAAYLAQTLETAVVNVLLIARADRHRHRRPFDVDDVFSKLFRQPLGTNVGSVRDLIGDDFEHAEVLLEAVQRRNDLIHHFWRRRILKMGTTTGREELVSELEELIGFFHDVDGRLQGHVRAKLEERGIDEPTLMGMYAEFEAASRGERPVDPEWTSY
ncbi:hypothetical protein GKE82_25085 [Conexibacter sp. W3-3-2]|uniref:hypothetical protein n=1 Tax=Conexibacter sp. W3-3-2 TaxID=2675227 RepID=UPI0012B91238|nr:hypothetical protein [Conexibacter sp. W3-3-2]MTD47481.1 hypothetical protein [Conexibacter sp. W3-3-2]